MIESSIYDDYEAYRGMMLEEAELILKDKKSYIKTSSITSSVKIYNLDQIIDFFYLEGENIIVQELYNIKGAIIIRHFLTRVFDDI